MSTNITVSNTTTSSTVCSNGVCSINDILEDKEEEKVEKVEITEKNADRIIMDLSRNLTTRLDALNFLNEKNQDLLLNSLNKLSGMYQFSGTKSIKNYLCDICQKSNISPFLKSICAKSLYDTNEQDEVAYQQIADVYPLLGIDVATPYKLELLNILILNDKYKNQVTKFLCDIVKDKTLSSKFRHQTILKLEYKIPQINNKLPEEEQKRLKDIHIKQYDKYAYFMVEAFNIFIRDTENNINDRVLGCQFMMRRLSEEYKKNTEYFTTTENILLTIAVDKNNEYDTRADATDILLRYSSGKTLEQATLVIVELGSMGLKKPKTIYQNAQNVHNRSIEDSVMEALEFLQKFDVEKDITLESVSNKIYKLLDDDKSPDIQEKRQRITISLSRISMDRALYSKYNCSLENILLKIWTYIQDHVSKDEMLKRLIEELSDMSGTCSSGFASRLVNTISGFGDFTIRISWKDQITSNFSGRLNALVRDMDNLKLRDKIIAEMSIDSEKIGERKHFLKFLRKNVPYMREELREEFCVHISENDFDLYFRQAISMYESGS